MTPTERADEPQEKDQASRSAKDKALATITAQVERLADTLERSSLAELVELYRHPRRMLLLSLAGGLMRGVGTALGFTAVAALVIYLLGRLASLNLPVIGEFIADITRIVERELKLRPPGL